VPYVAPDLIRYTETSVAVELNGRHTRGMTVCDLRDVRSDAVTDIAGAARINAKVAIEARSRPLIDLVVASIRAYA